MNMLSTTRLQRKVMNNLKYLIIMASLLIVVSDIHSLARSENDEYLPAPQGLKVDGLPPIPLQLVEKAGRYTYSRAAVLQSWHPSKRECLVTTRFAETTQAHRVAVPGGDRHQLTFFKDRVLSAAFHPVDGRSVVLLKDKDGDERDQLYRLDVNSNDITQLTFDKLCTKSHRSSHMLIINEARTQHLVFTADFLCKERSHDRGLRLSLSE